MTGLCDFRVILLCCVTIVIWTIFPKVSDDTRNVIARRCYERIGNVF